MLNFFQSIIHFIEGIWSFINHIISSTIAMIDFISGAITVPIFLQTYMPPIVTACITIVCGISIVKIVVGR